MKKIAIFVEGLTERIFIDKLLRELISSKKLAIKSVDAKGGKKCPRFTSTIIEDTVIDEVKFQILLYNSCTDNRVISDLRDEYDSLKNQGYSCFIAIRDLYPDYIYSEKEEAFSDVSFFISNLINASVVFATMETETWFIGELKHYSKINSDLTIDYIKEKLIDLESINNFEEDISEPADMLDKIYQLKNETWNKREDNTKRTVDSLDYENLYLNIRYKIPSLNQLITELDTFFEIVE